MATKKIKEDEEIKRRTGKIPKMNIDEKGNGKSFKITPMNDKGIPGFSNKIFSRIERIQNRISDKIDFITTLPVSIFFLLI